MENQKRHEQPTNSVRRSLKRKLEDEFIVDRKITSSDDAAQQDLVSEVRAQVEILDSTFSSNESDRALVKRSIHILSELAKNGMNLRLICFYVSISRFSVHIPFYESRYNVSVVFNLWW